MPHTRLRLPVHPSMELPPNSPSITVFQVRYEMQIFNPLKCEESRRMCVVVSRFFSFNTQCWKCFRCSRHDLVGRMCRLENQDQEAPNMFRDVLRLSSDVGQWAVGNGRCRTKIASWMDVISAWLSSFQLKREGYTEMGVFFGRSGRCRR